MSQDYENRYGKKYTKENVRAYLIPKTKTGYQKAIDAYAAQRQKFLRDYSTAAQKSKQEASEIIVDNQVGTSDP